VHWRGQPEEFLLTTHVVHLPDANGNMRGFKPTKSYRSALGAFTELKINDTELAPRMEFMTMDDQGRTRDWHGTPLVPWHGNTRAGSLDATAIGEQPVEHTPHHEVPVSCSFTPFYDQNVMLPNGDVVLCCMDYSLKHKLGNLITGDYYDLFASPVLAHLHAENMKHCHSDTICKKCTRARRHVLIDNHHHFWEVQP
jgi:Iron-sulfur cluster-binding domain